MKIPGFEDGGPSVAPTPAPTPYAQAPGADVFGAQLGGTLEQVGSHITAAATLEKEHANAQRVSQADLEFGQAGTAALYDKTSGFLMQQGENALDTNKPVKALSDAKSKIAAGLANDEQKKLFLQRASMREEQFHEAIERHSGEQRHALFQETAKGQAQLMMDTIGLNYSRPEAVDAAVKLATGPILMNLQDSQGLPTAERDAQVLALKQAGYGAALDGYIRAHDATGAERYLNGYTDESGVVHKGIKDQLGGAAPKYAGEVDTLLVQQVAGKKATEFINSAIPKDKDGNPTNSPPDLGLALADWNKLPDDTVRNATIKNETLRLIKGRFVDFKEAAAQRDNDGLATIELGIRNAPTPGTLDQSSDAFRALSPEAKEKAKAMADAVLFEYLRNQNITTDTALKEQQRRDHTIHANVMAKPPIDRAKVGPSDYAGASPDMVGQVKDLARGAQLEVKKDGGVAANQFDGLLKKALKDAGKFNVPAANANAAAYMTDWYTKERAKDPTFQPSILEIRKKIATDLLVVGSTPGAIFGDVWGNQMTREEAIRAGKLGAWRPDTMRLRDLKSGEVRVGPKGAVPEGFEEVK